MNRSSIRSREIVAATTALLVLVGSVGSVYAQSIPIAQSPLFAKSAQPPLNMLVLGRDQKIFNAAYNDASDLDGDGTLDVGYKPAITYYGYFDSFKCYDYGSGVFTPTGTTASKKCAGHWSGDYLNYVTTSRIDALRKVLYGGYRSTDTTTQTVLERAYIPQDGHIFGKEYQSVARDGYDVADYTPYSAPAAGRYLLFANETLISAVAASGTLRNPQSPPLMRVMQNSPFRIWNWLAIEGPVGGNDCFDTSNSRVDCLTGGGAAGASTWGVIPSSAFAGLTKTQFSLLPEKTNNQSADQADMDRLFPLSNSLNGAVRKTCGSAPASNIDGSGNQFKGMNGCPNTDDDYLTEFGGTLNIVAPGTYRFAVNGDDAVEVYIDGALAASWYGPHGACNGCTTEHAGTAINLGVGNHSVVFRHQELGGGDSYQLLWLPPAAAAASRLDYTVRVEVCKTGLLEANCEKYTSSTTPATTTYKPTGLLHDYGETGRMMFGLVSGSFMHNHQGGVLRKEMGAFTDEVNADTGQFVSPKKGLIATFDGIKIQSLDSDSNPYSNPHYNYNCNPGWSAIQPDGSCRPWGNPIGEMMFEALRYFAGASGPAPEYKYTDNGSDDKTLGLPEVTTWKDPYKSVANGGGGFLACAKPFETVVSDINPSYDSNLPGSTFGGAPTGSLPATLTGLDVGALGSAMWSNEGYGSKNIYIGQSGTNNDSAPTAKIATSFGTIRGLPEEPTKEGSYTAAEVAFYAHTHAVNQAQVPSDPTAKPTATMSTFAVALSSPLPRIEFPVNGKTISLVPFAKTVSGVSGASPTTFQPTNQIVGFYITKIANYPGAPVDVTVNNGLPYASFRISYEDAEQGNDYDMDAIASYDIFANADNTISVHMKSEYAAGSATQHMGYVISGSSQDGIYLEVVDVADGNPSQPSAQVLYRLNTPPGLAAGACAVATPPAACNGLPLDTTRTFAVGTQAPASVLNDPLWFAAKYGGFKDDGTGAQGDGLPNAGEWDSDLTRPGTPANYFLVTNALGLKDQLQKAFDSIISAAAPTGSVAASGSRYTATGTLGYQTSYLPSDWTGDVQAFPINNDGSLAAAPTWKASAKLQAPAVRKIYTSQRTGAILPPLLAGTLTPTAFKTANLNTATKALLTTGSGSTVYNIDDVINYLRGDQSKETTATPPGAYRSRTTRIGDIVGSNAVVGFKSSYGYQTLPTTVNGIRTGTASYQNYVISKPDNPAVFVGANDGMLHAFNGAASGGEELFGYIPNAVLGKLNLLLDPGYTHTYYVDGTPALGDIYAAGWKTVLIGSAGAGARSVFGLDVSNPASFTQSNVLWEFNSDDDPDLGYSLGVPATPTITGDGRWVTAFGNGYNSPNGKAILFVLDANTGQKISEVDTGYGGSSNSVNCGSANAPRTCPNGLSSATIVDGDGDGIGDTIYAGDYQGNLWEFDLGCRPLLGIVCLPPLTGTQWQLGHGGKPLFTARDPNGLPQPISSGIYAVPNALGGVIVYFGTGKYFQASDADPNSSAVINSIYAVWDNPANANTTLTRTYLQQQTVTSVTGDDTNGKIGTSSNLFDYQQEFPPTGAFSKMGFYLDLTYTSSGTDLLKGDRVIAAPNGILGSLLVYAYRPTQDECNPEGVNSFFELDQFSGAAAFSSLTPPASGVPTTGIGGSNLGQGAPLGTPNPITSIPGQPSIPTIGCPDGGPNCTPNGGTPDWCTVGVAGYPNCAPPGWCPGGGNTGTAGCVPPAGCNPGTTDFPYYGACKVPAQQCKWFNPGTSVGNQIACRVSWRQLR